MDNQFPLMLYGFPSIGRDQVQLEDGIYDTVVVADAAQHAAALAEGWFEHWPDAKAAATAAKQASAAKAAANAETAPPTRAELEQKAAELGITFAPNIGDAKLAERIAEKLKG